MLQRTFNKNYQGILLRTILLIPSLSVGRYIRVYFFFISDFVFPFSKKTTKDRKVSGMIDF